MPTPFTVTSFFLLCTLNSAGTLSPVDKTALPPGWTTPMNFNEQGCMLLRGKFEHPEKYVCQQFVGAKETEWTLGGTIPAGTVAPVSPPAEQRRGSLDDVQIGPTQLAEKD